MPTSAEVVHQFLNALGKRDFESAHAVLAKGFTFRGPFDTLEDANSYLEALKKLYPIVKSIEILRLFEDGDEACLLYDMETNTPIGTSFICEWFKVRDGQIVSIRAVFDARPLLQCSQSETKGEVKSY